MSGTSPDSVAYPVVGYGVAVALDDGTGTYNWATLTESGTGQPVRMLAQGEDANVSIALVPKGTGGAWIGSNYANYVTLTGAAAGGDPIIAAAGADASIDLDVRGKGSGGVFLGSNAANYISALGAAASSGPSLSAVGSDSNIPLNIAGKGTSGVFLASQFANYWTATGAAAGSHPTMAVAGASTNINLRLVPKGTGFTETRRLSVGTANGAATLFDGTRALDIWSNPTYSGAIVGTFRSNINSQGTTTNTGQFVHNLFGTADALRAPSAGSVANVASYMTVSAGAQTPRIGMQSSLVIAGATADPVGNNFFHQAFYGEARSNATLGGTGAGVGNQGGNLFGGNIVAKAASGALYLNSVIGWEVGVSVAAGASTLYKNGLQIVAESPDTVSGSQGVDCALVFGRQNSGTPAGWDMGICFAHPFGWWPLKSTATIIGTFTPSAAGPALAASYGVDFNAITFSSGAFRSPGFLVDGAGKVTGSSLEVGTSGPRIVSATGAPSVVLVLPRGTLYLRTDGGVGSTVYVSQGAGTWNAIAGV